MRFFALPQRFKARFDCLWCRDTPAITYHADSARAKVDISGYTFSTLGDSSAAFFLHRICGHFLDCTFGHFMAFDGGDVLLYGWRAWVFMLFCAHDFASSLHTQISLISLPAAMIFWMRMAILRFVSAEARWGAVFRAEKVRPYLRSASPRSLEYFPSLLR